MEQKMIDFRDVEIVEIEMRNGVIWVNIDGLCALRVYGHKHLRISGIPKGVIKNGQD